MKMGFPFQGGKNVLKSGSGDGRPPQGTVHCKRSDFMERGLHAEKAVTVQKVSQNVACSAGAGFNPVASAWAGPGAARHGARQVCSPCTGRGRTAGVTDKGTPLSSQRPLRV